MVDFSTLKPGDKVLWRGAFNSRSAPSEHYMKLETEGRLLTFVQIILSHGNGQCADFSDPALKEGTWHLWQEEVFPLEDTE
jgi:hypothetical protein